MQWLLLSRLKILVRLALKLISTKEWKTLNRFIKSPAKHLYRSSPVVIKRCSENMQQNYWRTPTTKCDSAWVFFSKFAAYFQSTFSQEHLWSAASVSRCFSTTLFCLNVPLSNWTPLHILLSFINTFSTSHLFGQTIVYKNIWLENIRVEYKVMWIWPSTIPYCLIYGGIC